MEFNHFFITRFNLKQKDWKKTKNGEVVLSDTWLKNRFDLFENYCLPSVKNQKNQKFEWCVFFDSNTSKLYRDRISKIQGEYLNFKPIFIDGMELLNQSFKEYILKNNNSNYVITSRLDNDDILHCDFVETIQNKFQPIDKIVIDLRYGYSVSLEGIKCEIRYFNFPFNPFVSLVENTEKIETVMSKMHREWKNSANIIVEESKPLWVEYVHHENKYNFKRKSFKRTTNFSNEDFGLVDEYCFQENKIGVLLNNLKIEQKLLKNKIESKLGTVAKTLLKK